MQTEPASDLKTSLLVTAETNKVGVKEDQTHEKQDQ